METTLNIVIIGTGNVAYHIAQSFQSIPHINIAQVFNHRLSKEAKYFAKQCHCELATEYLNIKPHADIYIVAVKDDAIVEVVKNLSALHLKGMVAHTAGSIDLDVLNNVYKNTGVYYPLQTFYKGAQIDWKTTPILIEGNTKAAQRQLKQLASLVSTNIKLVDSKARLHIHLAAVFACNFTNAMYVSAYEIIETQLDKKDTQLLQPLMLQSFHKLQTLHPKKAQTGPAKRNDQLTMKKHLKELKSNKQLALVYKIVSDLIKTQQNIL